jgi:large subunit ribosomal protein L4
MPVVKVYSQTKDELSSMELNDAIFGVEPKEHLFHLMVRYQLAKRRAGTHAVKSRAQVSGGGRKPFKQKGTGRARAGTTRSPIWRGGGVVHGPQVRSHAFKVPKKVRRAALCSALSRRVQDERLWVLDKLELPEIKTRLMKQVLDTFGWDKVCIVLPEVDESVRKSARNIPGLTVLPVEGLNVYDILRHGHLVVTVDALERLNQRLGR